MLGRRAIEARFGAASLAEISEYLGRTLPGLGPFEGSVVVSDQDGSLGIENLHVEGGRRNTLHVSVDGRSVPWNGARSSASRRPR